ncbi:MAG: alternative ribosome rescue aminoacyl-tRNA hydrolase ArfB [Dehalococcoidia bacterium]|nr:alternative ribosome rescue aminoacyl-tRNA hydrolase ArfB [Dehalococcoidia bacterium]
MINITPSITIDEKEIQQEFIRSTGPGGQNVNKVATAVQLRFDVANSPSLPEEVRRRLFSLGKKRITVEGILIIEARRYRTQGANRLDAVERLVELIRKAAEKPRIRRKTRPTLASRERRLESKKRRGDTKRFRGPLPGPADL